MRSHCFERLAPATTPSILRDPARIVYYNVCGPGMIVEVRKRYCEATGSMVVMRYRFGRIPVMEFSLKTSSQFSNGIPQSLDGEVSEDTTWSTRPQIMGFDEPLFPSTNLVFLDFLHDGNGPLLSILLVPLFGAPFDSEQMDRWLDFLFLYNPKIQAYFTFDDHACVQ